MQKLFPGILLVFGLTVVALLSDMIGVTFQQINREMDPVESVPAATDVYRPVLLRGGIPPH